MSNKPITINKLRTIIRLDLEGVGLKPIIAMCHTSRNTVKKYILRYNERQLDYASFQRKSIQNLTHCFVSLKIVLPRLISHESFSFEFRISIARSNTSSRPSRIPIIVCFTISSIRTPIRCVSPLSG